MNSTVQNQIKRRNTSQKQIILQTLCKLHSHVSAGAIYRELQKTYPEIGRATVYRVLSDMADDGLLLKFRIDGGEECYDITTEPHHHIKCRVCGHVDDIILGTIPAEAIPTTNTSGFTVEKLHIEFIGLCKNCRLKK